MIVSAVQMESDYRRMVEWPVGEMHSYKGLTAHRWLRALSRR